MMKEVACSKQAVKKFKKKHVLLTGASGSLGRAFGLHLARCGVRTLVLSGRNEIFLQHLANECREISTSFMEVHVVVCDLSDPVQVTKLGFQAHILNVNVLINNAAVMIRDDFLETSSEVDQMMLQVNFLSGVALCKILVPSMVKRGEGLVLWISSVQGFFSLPGCASFSASKFAVQGFCEALRGELGKTGITVHVASPGFIRTKFEKAADIDTSARKSKGALPDKVAADILNLVAKGKNDFLVASCLSDRTSMWMRFLAPNVWNRHLVKVHEENLRLAAVKAADDICINDGLKEQEYDKDIHLELKNVDTDTVSVVSQQSELKKTEDLDDCDAVLVETPSDFHADKAVEESKDSDSDSVESVGSQLVRLAAAH
jgi:short-subunit dehydrogenase